MTGRRDNSGSGLLRRHLIWALGLVLAVAITEVAPAANTQTVSASFSPNLLPQNRRAGGALKIVTTTGTTGSGVGAIKPATRARIFHDRDIAFFTNGLDRCDIGRIQDTQTELARQRCATSRVGAGTGFVQIAGDPTPADRQPVVITAFNGRLNHGRPTILLHTRVDAIASTVVQTGILQEAQLPFGAMLNISAPLLPFRTALTRFQVRLQRNFRFRGQQRRYVWAKCSRNNRTWRFRSIFSYAGNPNLTRNTTQRCRVRR